MVKGWPQFSPRGVITPGNAVRPTSSEAERTSRDEVTRRKGRTVTLFRRPRNRRGRDEIEQHAKIETLPDEILLDIFDCFRLAVATDSDSDRSDDPPSSVGPTWKPWEWYRLVHVCQRWRSLVFASPHRLDLRLVCTFNRPARLRKKVLEIWPTLPIAVWYPYQSAVQGRSLILVVDENNVSVALQYPDRIREINLFVTCSLLLKLGAQVLVSFPALEYLQLESPTKPTLALPVGFLGGTTPKLRVIHLTSIAFPTLPLLLLSTRDLVSLRLDSVPRRGYISPEALAIGLSMTTRLKILRIHFLPYASNVFKDTGSAERPLTTRAILPVLSDFQFSGDGAYLEDLISRLDAPSLELLNITLFKPNSFESLQLSQFISRTKSFASPHQLSIVLLRDEILVVNHFHSPPLTSHFLLQITSEDMDLQDTLPQVLTRLSVLLSGVQRLILNSFIPRSSWLGPDDMDLPLWLDFFCNLKSVKRLDVSGVFVQSIESALERLPEDMVQRVLPALQDLHVEKCESPGGPFQKFADALQYSGRPITVHYVVYFLMPKTRLDESPDPAPDLRSVESRTVR